MADLKVKYSQLIAAAQQGNVQNLNVSESNNVLRLSGQASQEVKDKLWDLYAKADPDMRSGDLVMDIDVKSNTGGGSMYEVKSGDNLSKIAQHYPGMTWQKIFDANKDVLKDPNKIYPGQKIKIPTA